MDELQTAGAPLSQASWGRKMGNSRRPIAYTARGLGTIFWIFQAKFLWTS